MAEQLLAGVARATSGLPEDHTALVFGDRRTSFTELDSRANKVANGLLSLGATDQERVAILDHSSDQFYEVWIGAARANLALTPLNIRLSAPEIAHILADCRPRVLFVGPAFEKLVDEIKTELDFIDHYIVMGEEFSAWRDQQVDSIFESTMTGHDDCLQIYTSGTTGLPAPGAVFHSGGSLRSPVRSLPGCGDEERRK